MVRSIRLRVAELAGFSDAPNQEPVVYDHCERKGYRKTPVKGSTVKEAATDDKHEQSV